MNTLGILNQLKQDISWESTFKTMKMVIFNTLLFRLKTFCFGRRKKSSKRLPWVIGGAFVFVILCNLSPRVCLCDVILYRPFQSTPPSRTHTHTALRFKNTSPFPYTLSTLVCYYDFINIYLFCIIYCIYLLLLLHLFIFIYFTT